MALMRVQFKGTSINKQTNMTVILPQGTEQESPFPALYQLHGYSDDDTAWTRWSHIERAVEKLPLVVVMPDGAHSYYTDAHNGLPYETHILRDVIGFAERFLPIIPERRARCIGGLSMGGYGATKLALKYPEMFCSVAAHSSVFDVGWLGQRRAERSDEILRTFGPDPVGGPNDTFQLARDIDRALLPAIRFDCGTEDFLIGENRKFHAHLEALGIPHEYEEFPGCHEWAYWDARIEQAVAFQAAALGIAPASGPP